MKERLKDIIFVSLTGDLMPTGVDYRFLYVILYNKGKGYSFGTDQATKSIEQIFIEEGYEVIYAPEYEGDIIVGKKDNQLIGVASLWGPWAINLSGKDSLS